MLKTSPVRSSAGLLIKPVPKARRFWHRVFPEVFSETLMAGDLEFFGGEGERALAKAATVHIERADSARARKRLEALAEEVIGDASWNIGESPDYFGFLWKDARRQGVPLGVVTFSLHINDSEDPRTQRPPIRSMELEMHLVFVRSKHRGHGYGQYLSAGVACWAQGWRLKPPMCPKKGVEVFYHADFESRGGEKCSNLIVNHLRFMQETYADDAEYDMYIREVHEDTGY